MSDKVEIRSIVITIGDSLVHLPIEKAKELQKQLNDLFGVEKEIEYVPYAPNNPWGTPRPTPWWESPVTC